MLEGTLQEEGAVFPGSNVPAFVSSCSYHPATCSTNKGHTMLHSSHMSQTRHTMNSQTHLSTVNTWPPDVDTPGLASTPCSPLHWACSHYPNSCVYPPTSLGPPEFLSGVPCLPDSAAYNLWLGGSAFWATADQPWAGQLSKLLTSSEAQPYFL